MSEKNLLKCEEYDIIKHTLIYKGNIFPAFRLKWLLKNLAGVYSDH